MIRLRATALVLGVFALACGSDDDDGDKKGSGGSASGGQRRSGKWRHRGRFRGQCKRRCGRQRERRCGRQRERRRGRQRRIRRRWRSRRRRNRRNIGGLRLQGGKQWRDGDGSGVVQTLRQLEKGQLGRGRLRQRLHPVDGRQSIQLTGPRASSPSSWVSTKPDVTVFPGEAALAKAAIPPSTTILGCATLTQPVPTA